MIFEVKFTALIMKRITALLLSLVMMISSVILLASCNEEETPEKTPIQISDGNKAFAEGDIFEERAAVDDELTYDGKCIFAISDFNYSAVACTYCLIFNKNLANSYDLGNLYEVVDSGDWTYDYFYNLIKDVYTDSDGDGEHTILAVPKTAKDTEFVGTCIEALSAESYKQVIPTFYEIALKTRYLRDNESKKMLDIIIDNRLFDFGYVYDGFKGFAYTLNDMFSSGSSNFESYYSREYTSVRSHFKVIIKAFDKLS